ncbi:MAG: histidine phosphatase family protein [Gammaproteobacteria bacterium]|nr:histidine phosphatase family protein [Gammaproteobacteria bacterium]
MKFFRPKKLPPSLQLTFVRHAQSKWNLAGLVQGQDRDPTITLTDVGRASIPMLLSTLGPKPDLIISSPLKRCIETARIWRNSSFDPSTPIVLSEALAEISAGSYEGLRLADLKNDLLWKKWMETPQDFPGFPKGESLVDFEQRVLAGVSNICVKNDSLDHIYVFTHGVVMRVIKCFLAEQDLSHLWAHQVENLEQLTLTPDQIERFQKLQVQSKNMFNG